MDYAADVPREVVATARPGGDAIAAMGTELASGLLLEADGQVVPMTLREPIGAPVESSEHTLAFTVKLTARPPPGVEVLRVSTANLPDVQSFYAGDVRVEPGLRLADCSLVHVREGRIVRDDTLRWTRDTPALAVTMASPEPGWWAWLSPPPPEPQRAAKALVLSPLRRAPELAVGFAVGGAAVGAVVGRGRAALALVALVGVVAALVGLPWRAIAVVALATSAAAAVRGAPRSRG